MKINVTTHHVEVASKLKLWIHFGGKGKEMLYLTMHSTHFIYGYIASFWRTKYYYFTMQPSTLCDLIKFLTDNRIQILQGVRIQPDVSRSRSPKCCRMDWTAERLCKITTDHLQSCQISGNYAPTPIIKGHITMQNILFWLTRIV